MKERLLAALLALCAFLPAALSAQEDLLDADPDSLFGAAPEEAADAGAAPPPPERGTSEALIIRPGFVLDASYLIALGIFPGFYEVPWDFPSPWKFDPDRDSFETIVGATMSATLGLVIQPSDVLRVRQTVTFGIPVQKEGEIPISFKEFYVDYNLLNKAYIRAGKFDFRWGWSPNYPYTDLPSRIPLGKSAGAAYTLRGDIPIGIGGLQILAIARSGLIEDIKKPKIEEFGFGLKYNIAIPFIDVDIGTFVHRDMPFRAFISMNKTLPWSLEAYMEAMASYDHDINWEEWQDFLFSYNVGIVQDFFGRKLKINAELFYNAESSDWAVTKNKIKEDEEDKTSLFSGFNTALNISFNPHIFFNTTFFASALVSFESRSAQVVPGIRLEPLRHLKVYLTLQMILGRGREADSYYHSNADTKNRPFAFSIIALLNGVYNFNHFER